jgi:hypothetical protein
MRRFLRTAATAVLLATAVIAGAPAAAYAASCHHVQQTSGNGYGILNNLQVNLPVDIGLDITRNALGVLGVAASTGDDTSTTNC